MWRAARLTSRVRDRPIVLYAGNGMMSCRARDHLDFDRPPSISSTDEQRTMRGSSGFARYQAARRCVIPLRRLLHFGRKTSARAVMLDQAGAGSGGGVRGLAKTRAEEFRLGERGEVGMGHVDLAARLGTSASLRMALAGSAAVVPTLAVTFSPSRSVAARLAGQALLTAQRQRQTIDLRFGGEGDRLPVGGEGNVDAAPRIARVLVGEGVVERQHRRHAHIEPREFAQCRHRHRTSAPGARIERAP